MTHQAVTSGEEWKYRDGRGGSARNLYGMWESFRGK